LFAVTCLKRSVSGWTYIQRRLSYFFEFITCNSVSFPDQYDKPLRVLSSVFPIPHPFPLAETVPNESRSRKQLKFYIPFFSGSYRHFVPPPVSFPLKPDWVSSGFFLTFQVGIVRATYPSPHSFSYLLASRFCGRRITFLTPHNPRAFPLLKYFFFLPPRTMAHWSPSSCFFGMLLIVVYSA